MLRLLSCQACQASKAEHSVYIRTLAFCVTSLARKQRGILTTAQHVARSTAACMLDGLASEQCSTCSTASWASSARHARQRA